MGLGLPICSDFIVAITAVHRSAFAGLKRYFGFLAALGTHYGVHLARSVAVAATRTVALRLSCLAAGRASLGLVGISFGPEELLLLGAEGEGSSAVGALK